MTTAKILLIIFTLVSSQDDWPKYEKAMLERYKQAESDGIDSNLNSFLNRVLIADCTNMKNTEENIKKVMYMLAMYYKHECTLPTACEDVLFRYKDKLFSIFQKAIKESINSEAEILNKRLEDQSKNNK